MRRPDLPVDFLEPNGIQPRNQFPAQLLHCGSVPIAGAFERQLAILIQQAPAQPYQDPSRNQNCAQK
jgi:hypothetical protein